jgi:hypothetical protein
MYLSINGYAGFTDSLYDRPHKSKLLVSGYWSLVAGFW